MRRKERLPILAVTCGDPAGVGPEIAVRAAVSRDVRRRARLVLVGPESVWSAAARVVGVGLRLVPFERRGRRPLRRNTVEFAATAEPGEWQWGKISAAGGEAAFRAVEKAAALIQNGSCDAMVTAPLNKESLRAAAVPYIGHTEILAGLTQSEDPLTVFLTGKLCVFFFTRHLPLSEVPSRLETEALHRFILRCRDTLREWGIAHPKLAVAGFNPHCGEHGLLGSEEMRAVEPAVRAAAAEGVDAVGPIGADSVFAQAAEGRCPGCSPARCSPAFPLSHSWPRSCFPVSFRFLSVFCLSVSGFPAVIYRNDRQYRKAEPGRHILFRLDGSIHNNPDSDQPAA